MEQTPTTKAQSLWFDELNSFEEHFRQTYADNAEETDGNRVHRIRKDVEAEDIIDEMLDLYLLGYAYGIQDTNESMETDEHPTAEQAEQSIYYRVDGKTFEDRVRDHIKTDAPVEDFIRIIETEGMRNFCSGGYDTAVKAGANWKIWRAVMDEKTRDTHFYLNGIKVAIDADFYSASGASAPEPRKFGVGEEDCNCRCTLRYEK